MKFPLYARIIYMVLIWPREELESLHDWMRYKLGITK